VSEACVSHPETDLEWFVLQSSRFARLIYGDNIAMPFGREKNMLDEILFPLKG